MSRMTHRRRHQLRCWDCSASCCPHLLVDPQQNALFLNAYGGPLALENLKYRVREYFNRAGIFKSGACHLFRHTMATLMLENGAAVRFIQEMLGHSSLQTTERYTHVSIAQLREIHAATHPGAKLQHKAAAVPQDLSDAVDSEPAHSGG